LIADINFYQALLERLICHFGGVSPGYFNCFVGNLLADVNFHDNEYPGKGDIEATIAVWNANF
jgi:hypothetical protein